MRRDLRAWLIGIVVVIAALVIGYAWQAQREQRRIRHQSALLTHGHPERGPAAITHYGCGGCHDIPGVTGAHGTIGPPLARFGQRAYVAGELRNTPENLVLWIMHPHAVEPKSAMPEMAVTENDARDIAAYVYTLN